MSSSRPLSAPLPYSAQPLHPKHCLSHFLVWSFFIVCLTSTIRAAASDWSVARTSRLLCKTCNGYRHNTQPYTVTTHLLASLHILLITYWRPSYIRSTSITSVISTLPSLDIHSLQAFCLLHIAPKPSGVKVVAPNQLHPVSCSRKSSMQPIMPPQLGQEVVDG